MKERVVMGAKLHPGKEPSERPRVELDLETKTAAAQVAEFRSPRFQVSLPAVVVTGLITALSGALIAWINKPSTAVLSAADQATLQRCANMAQDLAEVKGFVRWAEPQIGLLLVRTDSRAYTPPPRAEVPAPGFAEALQGKKP